MLNISACIITDNNPAVLNAIESVYDSVSEIVLVNTTDEFTLDISKYDKVKLYTFKWCDDFAKARNYSVSKATGDWILVIDSDEVLKDSLQGLTNDFDFYFIRIRNKKEYYVSIRIFRNHKSIIFRNMVHESVEESCKKLRGCKTDITFEHTGYAITQEQLREKAERNYRILCKDKKNPGKNIHFAKHHFTLGNYWEAIKYGNKVLKQKDINNDNKAIICIMIYEAYKCLGAGELGIGYLSNSIQLLPMQLHSRYLLVNYLYNLPEKNKHKELILKQLIAIGSLITFKNSEMSNDIYCDINFVNKTRKEIEKWQ